MTLRGPLCAAVFAIVATTPSAARSADAPADAVPYSRALPKAAPRGLLTRADWDGPVPVIGTVVIDDETGRPIEGAHVVAYAEDASPTDVRLDRRLGEGTSDAHGVANVRPSQWPGHWIVRAFGYADAYQQGHAPEETVPMRRGRDIPVQVVDPFDRPVAGASIEVYAAGACPHTPPFVTVRSDEDGRSVVPAVGLTTGRNLWISAPGLAHQLAYVDHREGDRPRTIRMAWGRRHVGRVRGRDGAPLARAVVRARHPRGPAVVASSEGSFVLTGAPADEDVLVFHPTQPFDWPGEGERRDGPAVIWTFRPADGVAADVAWTPRGLAIPPRTATLRVRLRVDGVVPANLSGAWIGVVRPDGVREEHAIAREGGELQASLSVPPGRMRVVDHGEFAPVEITPQIVDVAAAGTAIEIVGRMRPRLVIEGLPPDAGVAFVTTATGSTLMGSDRLDWTASVPTDGRVRVTAESATWRAVGEAGPARDGIRTAKLAVVPTPYVRIKLRSRRPIKDSMLRPARAPDAWFDTTEDGGGSVTRASGRMLVDATLEPDEPRLVAVDLPPDAARPLDFEVDLDAPELRRPVGAVKLEVIREDGRPIERVEIVADTIRGSIVPVVELRAPTDVRLEAPGLQPLRFRIDRPGGHRTVWPAGGIVVRVAGTGDRTCRALLDGALHDAVNGMLDVRGLAAGEHALVVSPADGPGVLWRFRLAKGQVLERLLTLPSK